MKKKYLKGLLAVMMLFLFFNVPAVAQTGFEDDVEDVPTDDDEPESPIDAYVIFALAGGCALGYRLLREKV